MEIDAGHVLNMLLPNGGWEITGNDFESIRYDAGVKPITLKEFEEGFTKYAIWKDEQEQLAAAAKQSLLNRLGITEDEAKLLLS